jgi:RNA ligase (TIGR02306 family)
MSSAIVEVTRILDIRKHPGADRLELATVKGWQCVVPIGKFKAGDLVTYIPIDTVIPPEQAERLGVANYLKNGRVRCARLRGEPSFGVCIALEGDWAEGDDVKDHYGITKYVPTPKGTQGPGRGPSHDAEADHPLFINYTDMENMRNFPDVFEPNEQVFVTEKIHGTCCRVGLIEGEFMAGSKGFRRKKPALQEEAAKHHYWYPLTLPSVVSLLNWLRPFHKQIVLFGEVYGTIQKGFAYDAPGTIGFRAFDLFIDGNYASYDHFYHLCGKHGVPTVPLIFAGGFHLPTIKMLSEGKTTISEAGHIREGVVVRPVVERRDRRVGRVLLKYVSDTYKFGPAEDEMTEDEEIATACVASES